MKRVTLLLAAIAGLSLAAAPAMAHHGHSHHHHGHSHHGHHHGHSHHGHHHHHVNTWHYVQPRVYVPYRAPQPVYTPPVRTFDIYSTTSGNHFDF